MERAHRKVRPFPFGADHLLPARSVNWSAAPGPLFALRTAQTTANNRIAPATHRTYSTMKLPLHAGSKVNALEHLPSRRDIGPAIT